MSRMGGLHTGVKGCECSECKTPCQGFKAPDGKILCENCLWKKWGIRPQDANK